MFKEFDDINEKLRQIEQEAEKIRAMQCEVEKQFQGSNNGSPGVVPSQMSVEDKMLIDGRSIYVGNVSLYFYLCILRKNILVILFESF